VLSSRSIVVEYGKQDYYVSTGWLVIFYTCVMSGSFKN